MEKKKRVNKCIRYEYGNELYILRSMVLSLTNFDEVKKACHDLHRDIEKFFSNDLIRFAS